MFTHFLQYAVVNASILYRDDKKIVRGNPGYNLKSFMDLLIKQLATPQLRNVGRHHTIKSTNSVDETKAMRNIGKHSFFLSGGGRPKKILEVTVKFARR